MNKFIPTLLFAAALCTSPASAKTPEFPLADVVSRTVATVGKTKAPLQRVGAATYRKLGFTIYHVTLWAPNGVYDPAKPYALQLRYARDLSQETLVDAVASDVEDQEKPDAATMATWTAMLNQSLPAVKDEEELIGLNMPGHDAELFFNGAPHARMPDARLTRAFFGIWLGDKADPDIRAKLTGVPVTK